MADVKIEIGYELPKERWKEAAENLMQAGKLLAVWFRMQNFEGRGQEDADEFMSDVVLACTALRYVAEYATDKCRMIQVPEWPWEEQKNG